MNYRGIQLKINLRNYWTIISIICLLVAFLGLHVNAYDREAAVSYAHNWWNTDIDGDGVHDDYNPAYNYYPYDPVTHSGGDCTNFVSQCLRYGGIRFSSDDGYVDNKGCLIRATELSPALLSSSHGGKTSGTLKIGDVASLSVPTKQYVHSIMIVVTAPVLFAAHTSDKDNEPLELYIGPGTWIDLNDNGVEDPGEGPISATYIYLPDAPIVKEVVLTSNGEEKYRAKQVPDTTNPVIEVSRIIGKGALEFEITFDCPMKTQNLPIVKFGKTSPYETYQIGNGSWSGSKTWIGSIEIDETFADGEYHISIYAEAEDGSQVDVDEDLTVYNPGNDTLHHFKIGPPFILTVNPPFAEVSKGETVTHTVTVKNNYVPESETFSLSAYGFAPGWSVSGLSESFSLEPGSEASYPFQVANSGGYGDVDIDVDLIAMAEMATQEVYDWSAEPYNPYEHPDETYEISSTIYPTPWKIDTNSKIGILLSGWGNGLGHLLGRWNVETVGVKSDLTIVGEPERDLSDLDVLLIGTGGLTGLDNSSTFRNKLAGFVSQGGVIICLTSQYGYELNGLPGSPAGYGWSEDQSCHTNAVYIDASHPIFSGQDSAILDASVDGYLTQWPNDATILLRRTKNQMPAMVKYEYGQGKVVVLTLYSGTGKDRKLL